MIKCNFTVYAILWLVVMLMVLPSLTYCRLLNWNLRLGFLSRTLTRDIDIAILSVSMSVCLSARLSVACLDLTRERKDVGSPKMARWTPTIRVTREPILRSKGQRSRSPGPDRLMCASSKRVWLWRLSRDLFAIAKFLFTTFCFPLFKPLGQSW